MSRLLGTIKRMFGGGGDRPPDLDATLNVLRTKTPTPVFWLVGKTQSGKTSIIKHLTGADDAVIGAGFRPTTKTTRRFDFPSSDAPLLAFLDTRGLDEPGYDATADVAALDGQAHVVVVTAKATDFAQGNVRAALEPIRAASPSRPVVLCVTTLHEAIPRQPHPTPYPFSVQESGVGGPESGTQGAGRTGAEPGSGLPNPDPRPTVPDDLRRCIEEHTRAFAGLFDVVVPIDLTRPEDGFPDPEYGGEQLKQALLTTLPGAYRQTLLRLKDATDALKDVHQRHAEPVILGYSTMAATAGAVPVPFVDMVIIPGIQARMAADLAKQYGQAMTMDRYREIAAAVGVGLVSRQLARQATKFIPVVGSAVGAAVGGASTYALGRALCYYFQAACEGHVPDAQALKAYYREQYSAAEQRWKKDAAAAKDRPPQV
ncbi:YcjF family protein [Gemmata sp.]|uniref:YcjF family protein n=1 Tax=Gemmata sp. TaxID=1914242 RepID=UPI003F708305